VGDGFVGVVVDGGELGLLRVEYFCRDCLVEMRPLICVRGSRRRRGRALGLLGGPVGVIRVSCELTVVLTLTIDFLFRKSRPKCNIRLGGVKIRSSPFAFASRINRGGNPLLH
jgi:hypothetical protein